MFRFTIKELLFLTVFVAIAVAALRYGGEFWTMTLSSCLLFGLMIATVMMFVDRGSRQAMAAGFVVCVVINWTTLLLPGFGYYVLPTMKLSQIVEDYSHLYFGVRAHLLWSLLFGYLGARFAGWVYARRIAEDARAPRSS